MTCYSFSLSCKSLPRLLMGMYTRVSVKYCIVLRVGLVFLPSS
ncbi:Uncharacterised protein [Vibrio cholerae]|nr:Uncharacterised protein [Vibrio cholerae]